jgi:hypothetical protein
LILFAANRHKVERTHGQMQREMMENNDNNTTMTQTDD